MDMKRKITPNFHRRMLILRIYINFSYLAHNLLLVILLEEINTMEQYKREIPTAVFMASRTYLAIPFKAYSYFLSKISGHCHETAYIPLRDLEEETMVGYESSWAGIDKNINLQQ